MRLNNFRLLGRLGNIYRRYLTQKEPVVVNIYDGKYASTPQSEYRNALDGCYSSSVYNPNVDVIADGGRAKRR